jgi:CubicO group peptidase (beta-lactamase class C family)
MRSVSKSFVGLLAGIAIGEGAINPSAPVLDYFPELADLRNPERNAINVEHLVTMRSGLHWEETLATYGRFTNDETHLYWAWNPDRRVLSRALDAPPGTRFNYSGGNTARFGRHYRAHDQDVAARLCLGVGFKRSPQAAPMRISCSTDGSF